MVTHLLYTSFHRVTCEKSRNCQQVADRWKSIIFVPIDTLNKTYPLRELNPCLRLEKAMSLPLDERDLISCSTNLLVLMVTRNTAIAWLYCEKGLNWYASCFLEKGTFTSGQQSKTRMLYCCLLARPSCGRNCAPILRTQLLHPSLCFFPIWIFSVQSNSYQQVVFAQ